MIIEHLLLRLFGVAMNQEPLHAGTEPVHDNWQFAGVSLTVLALAAACLLGVTPVPVAWSGGMHPPLNI